MTWFQRPTTPHERAEFARLRELYQLMKHWREQLTDLPWEAIASLEEEELDDALKAETSEELLTRIKISLRHSFEGWKNQLEISRQKPAWARVLRMTEEEAVRYTSAQWKGTGSQLFTSLSSVFAAYRETPFFTLYRDSLLMISSRSEKIEFTVNHPAYEMETAWMRGFTAVLRPKTQIASRDSVGCKIFEWKD